MHSRKARARSRQSTRLDDGALHTVGREWVWDAIDVADTLDTDAIVSTRVGETVARCRLTHPHARILNDGAVEAFAILNEDLAIREYVHASVDNDSVELQGEIFLDTVLDFKRKLSTADASVCDRRAGDTKECAAHGKGSETTAPSRSIPGHAAVRDTHGTRLHVQHSGVLVRPAV
jgi:hypothetical protein